MNLNKPKHLNNKSKRRITLITPDYDNNNVHLYNGDCFKILKSLKSGSVDCIITDPPYFLSNDGITCKSGKMVSVNKGKWDKRKGFDEVYNFNLDWIEESYRVLKEGGTIMEDLVDDLLQKVYGLDNSTYTTQGSPSTVKEKWGIDLPVDKSSRRPDFIVYKNNKLYWIETNFYSGGGSKLKSTCGEYKSLYDFCRKNGVEFIWITDGEGWKTTLKPLEETFLYNDYIFNLSMVKDGILNDLWS